MGDEEEYEEGMNPWSLLEKPKPIRTKQASPEEMHLYAKEVEEEMIAEVRQAARELMEDWKGSHDPCLWPELEERCQELAERRISALRMFFRTKRTGNPYHTDPATP